MVFLNYSTMQMVAKIVFYGPGLCGKTTNLKEIYKKTSPKSRGEMVSLETETDRTLFFDLLPMDVGVVGGFKTKFQLYTVPGQVFYNSTRKLVLRGVDGIVFVADSQKPMFDANVDSFENLQENLAEMGLDLDDIPLVYQYNKRDLPNIASVEELNESLNPLGRPYVQAAALQGVGVFETLKEVSKQTLLKLRDKATGQEPVKKEKPKLQVRGSEPAPKNEMPKNVSFDTYPGTPNEEVKPTSVPAPTPDAHPETSESLPDVSLHGAEVLRPDQEGQIQTVRENTLDSFDLDFPEDDSLADESLDLDEFNDIDIDDASLSGSEALLDTGGNDALLETSGPLEVSAGDSQDAADPLAAAVDGDLSDSDFAELDNVAAEAEAAVAAKNQNNDLLGDDPYEDQSIEFEDEFAGEDDLETIRAELTPSPDDNGELMPPEDDAELTFDESVFEEHETAGAGGTPLEMEVNLGPPSFADVHPDLKDGDPPPLVHNELDAFPSHDMSSEASISIEENPVNPSAADTIQLDADVHPDTFSKDQFGELSDPSATIEVSTFTSNEEEPPGLAGEEDALPTVTEREPDADPEPMVVEDGDFSAAVEADPVETVAAPTEEASNMASADGGSVDIQAGANVTEPEPMAEAEPAAEATPVEPVTETAPTQPEPAPVAEAAPEEPAAAAETAPEPEPPSEPTPAPAAEPDLTTKSKKKKSKSSGLDDLNSLTAGIRTKGKSKRKSVDSLLGGLGSTGGGEKKKAKLEKFQVEVPADFTNAQLNCVFLDEDENVIHTELLKVNAMELEPGTFQVRMTLDIKTK
ncbi:GTPase domain-containing protein [Acanthopleuribacter pedis]|uniref:GTPase domain-containing protein n=1 Tax=Acanthopleuribacter pedis TaxID=442870 RepID=A0A8J7QGZ8_9BACT|nr:GTPase domain-containing protein [Acanthopleuribacter pedis]MBO1318443.1 GTPase domain-containing protein [Acanthopleuribacter pedis]